MTSTNNKTKKYLIVAFNIIIGVLLILITIYSRLILVRLPKELYFFDTQGVNYRILFTTITGIIICGFVFIRNISLLIGRESSQGIISNIALKVNQIIEVALFEVSSILANSIPNGYDKISLLCQKFYKYFKNVSESFFLFILYFIRVIILLSFLIDVFIYFRLEYMYKALYLLCFVIFIKLLFYVMRDFANNLEASEELLVIEDKGIDTETNLPLTNYRLKEDYKHLDLVYHVNQFILCSKISGYLAFYDKYRLFFDPYFNASVYFLYSVGWCYILVVNLSFITTLPEVLLFQDNIEPFSQNALDKNLN